MTPIDIAQVELKRAHLALLCLRDRQILKRAWADRRFVNRDEHAQMLRRARVIFRLGLELYRDVQVPSRLWAPEDALIDSCVLLVDGYITQGEPFVAFAHGMELIELCDRLERVDAIYAQRGAAPFAAFLRPNAQALADLAQTLQRLSSQGVDASADERALLTDFLVRLRRDQREAIAVTSLRHTRPPRKFARTTWRRVDATTSGYAVLVASLQALASAPIDQLSLFPKYVLVPVELRACFEEARRSVVTRGPALSQAQDFSLGIITRHFDGMANEDEDLFVPTALMEAHQWRRLRFLAREALGELREADVLPSFGLGATYEPLQDAISSDPRGSMRP